MQIIGNIPKRVVYFPRNPTEVGFKWDDDSDNEVSSKITVRPAFCSDADNKKTRETGARWQENQNIYDQNAGEKAAPANDVIERDNDEISGLRIVALEYRGEGGRAYKVATREGFYFDFREDVLLDTILRSSIDEGVLSDTYIWAKLGSQMKLIRVHSELHRKLVEADERHRAAAINKDTLKPGQIYRNKKGEYRLYLGTFSTLEVLTEKPKQSYSGYGYGMKSNDYEYLGVKEHKKIQVWLEVPDYYFTSEKKSVKDFDSLVQSFVFVSGGYGDEGPSELLTYHLKFVKDSKVAEPDEHFIELPENYIQRIQDFVESYWVGKRANRSPQSSVYDKGYYSQLFHLSPVGTKPLLKKVFEK